MSRKEKGKKIMFQFLESGSSQKPTVVLLNNGTGRKEKKQLETVNPEGLVPSGLFVSQITSDAKSS